MNKNFKKPETRILETKNRQMTDAEYARKKLAPELRKYMSRSGRKILGAERGDEL